MSSTDPPVKKRVPRKKKTEPATAGDGEAVAVAAVAECAVCAESFNLSSRDKVTCEFSDCQYTACKQCVRTYLLSTTADPHCMNCKKEWGMKFLVAQLNRSYVTTEFRQHRAQLLLERELSRMPETMDLATRHKLARDEDKKMEEELKTIHELEVQIQKHRAKINEHRRVKYNYLYGDRTAKEKEEQDRRQFIMPCPNNECRGFLSTQYKCDMCDMFTCKDCHNVVGAKKDDPHTCNPDDVQSAELIKKDTRPCPKCGVRIFKISGCDQMWCTGCQTAFSWNTGKIDSGMVHNPHFFQFQRQNGTANANANAGPVGCGGPTAWHHMSVMILRINMQQRRNLEEIFYATQHINHLRNTVQAEIETLLNLQQIRINYILKDIDQDSVRKEAIERDVKRHKQQQIYNILDLVWTVSRDIFARMMQSNLSTISLEEAEKLCQSFLEEFEALRTYANQEFAYISATFNQSTPKLGPLFGVRSQKCTMKDSGMLKSSRRENENVVL